MRIIGIGRLFQLSRILHHSFLDEDEVVEQEQYELVLIHSHSGLGGYIQQLERIVGRCITSSLDVVPTQFS